MKQVQRHQRRRKFAAYNRQSFGKNKHFYSNMSKKHCQITQKGGIQVTIQIRKILIFNFLDNQMGHILKSRIEIYNFGYQLSKNF